MKNLEMEKKMDNKEFIKRKRESRHSDPFYPTDAIRRLRDADAELEQVKADNDRLRARLIIISNMKLKCFGQNVSGKPCSLMQYEAARILKGGE